MIIHIEFFLHIWMHIDDSYTLLARHGFLLFINWPMKCICKRELEYALYHDFFPKGIVHNLFSWMDWFMAYRQSWWPRGMFPGSLEFAHQAGRQLCSRRAGDFGHCRVVLRGSASALKFPPKLMVAQVQLQFQLQFRIHFPCIFGAEASCQEWQMSPFGSDATAPRWFQLAWGFDGQRFGTGIWR